VPGEVTSRAGKFPHYCFPHVVNLPYQRVSIGGVLSPATGSASATHLHPAVAPFASPWPHPLLVPSCAPTGIGVPSRLLLIFFTLATVCESMRGLLRLGCVQSCPWTAPRGVQVPGSGEHPGSVYIFLLPRAHQGQASVGKHRGTGHRSGASGGFPGHGAEGGRGREQRVRRWPRLSLFLSLPPAHLKQTAAAPARLLHLLVMFLVLVVLAAVWGEGAGRDAAPR